MMCKVDTLRFRCSHRAIIKKSECGGVHRLVYDDGTPSLTPACIPDTSWIISMESNCMLCQAAEKNKEYDRQLNLAVGFTQFVAQRRDPVLNRAVWVLYDELRDSINKKKYAIGRIQACCCGKVFIQKTTIQGKRSSTRRTSLLREEVTHPDHGSVVEDESEGETTASDDDSIDKLTLIPTVAVQHIGENAPEQMDETPVENAMDQDTGVDTISQFTPINTPANVQPSQEDHEPMIENHEPMDEDAEPMIEYDIPMLEDDEDLSPPLDGSPEQHHEGNNPPTTQSEETAHSAANPEANVTPTAPHEPPEPSSSMSTSTVSEESVGIDPNNLEQQIRIKVMTGMFWDTVNGKIPLPLPPRGRSAYTTPAFAAQAQAGSSSSASQRVAGGTESMDTSG
ncbi:hypothetical protein BU24DRAFT_480215 [Aaosphaeria arxii CBS 175.79]|uniref:Uncharacterized protein n=1 Tax=Aaosphaeria arxii CBS 175.79 TaxID=1450172 RepID=A0A6A5XQ88_9PLEO|nr:uncharacterized protein BU24DRAFT_480215 [Aaosphaeria arxii CBS 175.79]KAF2015445.1 hypothetical protein BU24DRAFT_480215 [Aaosphaeria arxii CBS 175.79]